MRAALEVLRTVPIPDFVKEPIRCAAVVPEDEAFFFGNYMEILDGDKRNRIPVSDYRKFTNEHLVPHSHAKHSLYEGRSYMVGALPRLTLNGDRIGGLARRPWKSCTLKFPPPNILMNNVAQVVEMVYLRRARSASYRRNARSRSRLRKTRCRTRFTPVPAPRPQKCPAERFSIPTRSTRRDGSRPRTSLRRQPRISATPKISCVQR